MATDNWHEFDTMIDEVESRMDPAVRALYAVHRAGLRAMGPNIRKRAVPVEKAAAVIERALTARRPRARYLVGADARAMLAMRALAPTPALDAGMARFGGWR